MVAPADLVNWLDSISAWAAKGKNLSASPARKHHCVAGFRRIEQKQGTVVPTRAARKCRRREREGGRSPCGAEFERCCHHDFEEPRWAARANDLRMSHSSVNIMSMVSRFFTSPHYRYAREAGGSCRSS